MTAPDRIPGSHYQWLFPTGSSWWVDAVARLHPPAWGIGATVPSLLVAFVLGGIAALLARRSAAGSAPA